MMRAAAGGGAGAGGGGMGRDFFEEEGEEGPVAEEEETGGWDEESGPMRSAAQEEAAAPGGEEEEGLAELGVRVKLDAKQLLARQGLLEEDDVVGMGRRGSARAQREAAGETEGSLWWHRNFAAGDEALVRAQTEAIE